MNNPLEPGTKVVLHVREGDLDVSTDDEVEVVAVTDYGIVVLHDYGGRRYVEFYPWHMIEAITVEV